MFALFLAVLLLDGVVERRGGVGECRGVQRKVALHSDLPHGTRFGKIARRGPEITLFFQELQKRDFFFFFHSHTYAGLEMQAEKTTHVCMAKHYSL